MLQTGVFVTVIKVLYPGCKGMDWYCHADIQYLVQDHMAKLMRDQDNLGEYTQTFHKISAVLIANKKLAEMKQDMPYLNGFLTILQQKICECLLIIKQDLHPDDPYSTSKLTTAAKFLLTKSAFQSSLLPKVVSA